MPTETQVDFRIWDHRSPEGDAIGVGFKEMGVMNGGLQRIPRTEPLCGGTLGSSEFLPRADPLQGDRHTGLGPQMEELFLGLGDQ